MSLVEAKSNAVIGLLVSWLFTYFCLPWFGLEPSPLDATGITASYFVLSLGRSYVLRRFFNRWVRWRHAACAWRVGDTSAVLDTARVRGGASGSAQGRTRFGS